MLTRNGDIALCMINMGTSMSSQNSSNRVYNINNATCYFSTSGINNTYIGKITSFIDFTTDVSSSISGLFLWIGDGATDLVLSKYNYDLGSRHDIADLGIGTQTLTFSNTGAPIVSAIFTNNTQSSMTINEVGLFAKSSGLALDDSNEYKCLLLGREIITAVTLEPNASIKVNFTFSMS